MGFLITMSRKEARSVVVMMDLDQNLFPQQQALVLLLISIDNIYYVIQYRCWCRNQWLSSSSQVVLANDCNGSTICIYYILNRKLQPDSNVLRITYSTRHERKPRLGMKPRLQDGTVMVDTNKYRLVGIPPRCRIDKDSLSTSNATMITKEWWNAIACDLRIRNRHRSEPRPCVLLKM